MRLLTILGSKGGIGKSTIASALLVAARLDGIDAAGLDLDDLRGLARWADRRAGAGLEPTCPVATASLREWRTGLPAAGLVVVDTPPGISDADAGAGLSSLAGASTLVLMPVTPEEASVAGLLGPAAALRRVIGRPVVAVLNRVPPRSSVIEDIRAELAEVAEVCPIEIPQRAEIQRALGRGFAVVEDERLGGAAEILALWRFAAGRLGVAR